MRKVIPVAILAPLGRARRKVLSAFHTGKKVDLEHDYPYVSPDVWQRITGFYTTLDCPAILEFGTGVSSCHHIQTLLDHGAGRYIGVEHQAHWFAADFAALARIASRNQYQLCASLKHGVAGAGTADVDAKITTPTGASVDVTFRLRPPNLPYDGDGTAIEFGAYLNALDEPVDVVVVDGRARNDCVQRALTTPMLRKGGMLALLDAGRGLPRWLGYPTQTGSSDYRLSVQRMVDLGGKMVNGVGIDRWPGLNRRRAHHPKSFFFPDEACFLIKP